MKSYRHSIAVPIGLLLIAAVLVLPWDAKISEWFHQDKFPGDLEKILDLAETFAHGIGIGAIIITLVLIDPTHRRATLLTALGTGFSGIMANVMDLITTAAIIIIAIIIITIIIITSSSSSS